MKKTIFTLFSLTLLFASCQKEQNEEKATEDVVVEENINTEEFSLGQTYSINSGNTAIVIAPEKGGRIASLTFGGEEFLSLWDTHQDNWGSTFWASPQTLWGWPPPKGFDVLPFSVLEADEEKVVIQGQIDQQTGLSFHKTITSPAEDVISIVYAMKNNTDSILNVAPWEITRAPINGLSFFVRGEYEKAPFTIIDTSGAIWFDYKNAQIQEGHDKLLADAAEGWLAHINEGVIMVKTFENINPTQSDPTEAEVAIYAHPEKLYIELEPQGPLYGLEPEEELSWEVKWYMAKVPSDIDIKAGNTALIDFAKSIIK